MAPQELKIRFRVEAHGSDGLRLKLAKLLAALISVLFKVRIRPELDHEAKARVAELKAHSMFIYRGTPAAVPIKPEPEPSSTPRIHSALEVCDECGYGTDRLSESVGRNLCRWCEADAKKKPEADPSPQGYVRCQICDYPTFRLAEVEGYRMCGWCAVQIQPESKCLNCNKPVSDLATYELHGRSPLCWECFNASISDTD